MTDADDDTASLQFLLTVDAAEPLDLRPTFDTDQRMSDDGKLIGRVPDDLRKSATGAAAGGMSGDAVGGATGSASSGASGGATGNASGSATSSALRLADRSYMQHQAIEPLSLPEASGGNQPLSYALEPALPQGMSFDTSARTVSGTPMTAQAPTLYTYTATDVDGDTASLAFTMTVAADLHPEFSADASINDLSWEQGELIDPLTLPAATGGDKPLTYALAPALPPGLSFDATTRVLSGTPETQVAAERYTYTVTDADGDTASLAFRLAAIAPPIAPAETDILTDSLASQGRAILGSTRRALDGRFRDTDRAADAAGLKTILSSWQNRLTAAATGNEATGVNATSGVRATALTPSIRAHPGIDTPGTDTSTNPGTPAAASAPATLPAEINLTSAYGTPNAGPIDGSPDAALPGAFGLSGLSGACGTQTPPDPSWPTPADSRVPNGWDDGACNGTPGLRLSDWLWGRRYALRLNGLFGDKQEDNEPRTGPDWTLWSAGDQRHVEGTPGENHYQTDWRSLHLGLDARFNTDWLAGVVVSRGWGETGYGFNGPGASGTGETGYGLSGPAVSGTGELETEVWTALPYLHGRLANGLEVWGLAGGGWGEVSATRQHEDGAEEDSNLSLWLGALGARRPLLGWGDLSLSFVGDAGFTFLSTNEGDGTGALDGLKAATQQLRIGLEGEYLTFFRSAEVAPFWQLSGRYDGGDGLSGAGLEAQAGLRYRSARLNLVAQGHWLGLHSEAGYQEYGASLEARISPLAGGHGLTLALSPRWGIAGALSGAGGGAGGIGAGGGMGGMSSAGSIGMGGASSVGTGGAGAMWDADIIRRAALANTGAAGANQSHVWSVDANLGYGLWLPYRLGLLTPFSELSLTGSNEQRQRLGLRLDVGGAQEPGGLQLELSGFRQSTYLEADSGVHFNATLKY